MAVPGKIDQNPEQIGKESSKKGDNLKITPAERFFHTGRQAQQIFRAKPAGADRQGAGHSGNNLEGIWAMGNLFAIHSFATSLMTYLRNSYPTELRSSHPCVFNVISSGELAELDNPGTMVTLYLYRVTVNEHSRNKRNLNLPGDSLPPLTLDLHFLLTIWADNAVAEQVICAWVMQELHRRPILDASSLSADGGWRPEETVQIVPTEISNEDLMRIWDALAPNYRLSISYAARVVSIYPASQEESLPVVATRFAYDSARNTGGP